MGEIGREEDSGRMRPQQDYHVQDGREGVHEVHIYLLYLEDTLNHKQHYSFSLEAHSSVVFGNEVILTPTKRNESKQTK